MVSGEMDEITHMYQCAIGGPCRIFNDLWALWDKMNMWYCNKLEIKNENQSKGNDWCW